MTSGESTRNMLYRHARHFMEARFPQESKEAEEYAQWYAATYYNRLERDWANHWDGLELFRAWRERNTH